MSESWRRLGDAQYINLATFRRDGREVRTPVWVAGDGDRLYAFSEGDAGKVKRIRATQRVGVAACDVRGRLKGEFSPGVGRIVDDPDTKRRAHRALQQKYGWQMTLLDFFSRLSGKIDKRAYLELEESPVP